MTFPVGDANLSFLARAGGSAIGLGLVGNADRSLMGCCDLCGPLFGTSRRPDEFLRPRPSTRRNTILQEPMPNHGAGDAEVLSERILRFAGQIFSDEIIDIERDPFHGNVYNLQTGRGYYVAEGVVTHNCDCMIGPA